MRGGTRILVRSKSLRLRMVSILLRACVIWTVPISRCRDWCLLIRMMWQRVRKLAEHETC